MNEPRSTLTRRRVFAGASTLGALAATAAVLPLAQQAELPVEPAKPEADQPAGYRLTAHVQRYYQTTKV